MFFHYLYLKKKGVHLLEYINLLDAIFHSLIKKEKMACELAHHFYVIEL